MTPLGQVVEISTPGHYLHKELGFLVIQKKGEEVGRIPIEDIGSLITSSMGTSISCRLLSELADRGIATVICDQRYNPSALLWPLSVHYAQQRRIEAQLAATRPLQKRLWSQLVTAKVARQAWALETTGRSGTGLLRLLARIRSGDPTNVEAHAAQRYWTSFFGSDFRRDRHAKGPNVLLNYGYTILRSATARAIAAAGLHPGVGIFHRGPRNSMPLADDLMEPFRPFVDIEVLGLIQAGNAELNGDVKKHLAAILLQTLPTERGDSPLGTCLFRLGQSLAKSYELGEPQLQLPSTSLHLGNSND